MGWREHRSGHSPAQFLPSETESTSSPHLSGLVFLGDRVQRLQGYGRSGPGPQGDLTASTLSLVKLCCRHMNKARLLSVAFAYFRAYL